MQFITGEFINESGVIYKKENGKLIRGLLFKNESVKWFPDYLLGRFHDDISCVMDKQTKDFGYLHRGGEFVIKPRFLSANDFREQRAFAFDGEKLLLIDTQGNIIVELPSQFVTGEFHEGLAIISEIDNESGGEMKTDGYVDIRGNIIIPLSYRNGITSPRIHHLEDDCSEGLIRVRKGLKFGYIDKTNKLVIPFHYDWGSRFNNGVAAVCKDDRYGYINASNDAVLPFEYAGAKQFRNGIAPVKISDKWGFIDIRGELIIPARFEGASYFYEGNAKIMLNGKMGLINCNGDIIVPPRYDAISFFQEGLCRFMIGGHEGVLDKKGNSLIGDLIENHYLLSNQTHLKIY